MNAFSFFQAETPEHLAAAREMFLEYAAWLGFSLCFQGFDQELAELPGRYAPPAGRLILARAGADYAGLIALRGLDAETCEMKRLYTRPAFRGQALGRRLVEYLLNEARAIGYRRMVLDTLPGQMDAAIALYRRLGFREIAPYYHNPVEGAIFMELDLQKTDAQAILAELVAVDSVSARSNVPLIECLERRAHSLGLRTERRPYLDANGVKKNNLIAFTGAETAAGPFALALVGHTDTVPYAADWADALTLTERDGKLYGRGSCDTKGFIAAALAAVARTDVTKLQQPLALVFTADEEIGCLGAKRLAHEQALTARYAIVGEPTSLQPMRAGKGYCLADVVVSGREGHSAYPAVGASAIFRTARLVTALEKLADELKNEPNAAFEPPQTTLNVGLIKGGTAKNIIAGQCRFTLEWRPVPGQGAEYVLGKLHEIVAQEQLNDPDFTCEIIPLRLDSGMETPPDSPLVKLLEQATGQAAGTIAFGTEAPQMAELGAQAVVLGPGDIRVAHRTGEFVPSDELEQCVSVLAQSIANLCL